MKTHKCVLSMLGVLCQEVLMQGLPSEMVCVDEPIPLSIGYVSWSAWDRKDLDGMEHQSDDGFQRTGRVVDDWPTSDRK